MVVKRFRTSLDRMRNPFSIKAEQIVPLASHENKDFSYLEAQKDFGFSPLSFEEGIKSELNSVFE